MPASEDQPVPGLLEQAARGEKGASDALFRALYRELHRLAESQIHRNAGAVTLSATTLLHEAYLSIAQRRHLDFPSENQFLAYASRAMRGLMTDYVRQKRAIKRGGDLTFSPLDEDKAGSSNGESPLDLEKLAEALLELENVDRALAELVDLKFFCGFSFTEIAAIRGLSERTVQRDWAKARMLLHKSISESDL